MIEVELPDGRILEFPEGTSQDVMKSAIQKLLAPVQETTATPSPQRGFGEMLYENIIGRGEVDTPGERLGEIIRGAGAATARGIADVPALPVNFAQLGAMGVEKALGMESPSSVSRGLAALPDTREMLASVPYIGPETEYVAPGTAGEYIATAGEFAGGAGLTAGPKAIARYGVAPGVASEAAGQATEGTDAEPYVRAGAALAAPIAAGVAGKAAQNVISPSAGQISPARQEAVEALRREGIQPTAGQAIGGTAAENQLYRETATAAGRARSDQAMGQFTAAVMKRIGSKSERATPDALEEAATRIGNSFDAIVEGVDVMPSTSNLNVMTEAVETYKQLAPKASAPPIFENVQAALAQAAQSGKPIPASSVKTWRSTISKLTKSPDPATRETAVIAIDALDDAINSSLIAAKKPKAVVDLREARGQYRNLLAIERAAQRSDIEGILSPLQLRTALIQQGRRRYVQGKGDLGPLTRAAADVLKPLPQSGTQPRTMANVLTSGATGGTGFGLGAVGLGMDPLSATAVGATAAVAPALRNKALASGLGQKYMQNQMLSQFGPLVDQRAVGVLPGLLSQN